MIGHYKDKSRQRKKLIFYLGFITSEHATMINFPLKMTLFFVFFFPIFVKLGLWQLDRYEHKSYSEKQQNIRKALPPLTLEQLTQLKTNELHNTPIIISGEFQNQISFLLDNQTLNGQLGFYLLMPFITEKNYKVLVNRGFLPYPEKGGIPAIPVFDHPTTITGILYQPPPPSFSLKKEKLSDGSPKIIQSIDFKKIRATINGQLPHAVLQITNNHPAALSEITPPLLTNSRKNFNYSILFFFMALVLLFVYINQIVRSRKKQYETYL